MEEILSKYKYNTRFDQSRHHKFKFEKLLKYKFEKMAKLHQRYKRIFTNHFFF